jgi:small subunit ribosomal protein S4e
MLMWINRIRYPDPAIKVNDTVKLDLTTGKITDFIRFDTGVIAMVTGGRNMGRVGVITHRERHDGGFNIVHIKDAIDNSFATRESNVFIIGKEKPWISLPKGKGVKVFVLHSLVRTLILTCFSSCLSPKREIVVALFSWPRVVLRLSHCREHADTGCLVRGKTRQNYRFPITTSVMDWKRCRVRPVAENASRHYTDQ